MLTVIGRVDRTNSIPFDSIKIESVQGDPLSKLSFTLEDPGSQIQLISQQEVIIFDENIALTPSFVVPSAWSDSLSSNDLTSYTSTNNPGGSAATWTYNAGSVTVTKVQSNMVASSGAVTSQAATLGVGVASGNLLVASVSSGSNATSVTPPAGWTQAAFNQPGGSANCESGIWYAIVGSGGVTAGTTSFTFTFGASHNVYIGIMELHSTTGWPASPVDVIATGNSSGTQNTTITSGTTATTTQATEFWFASLTYDGAAQAESGLTSGWTRDREVTDGSNNHTALMCYNIVSSTGAAVCSFTVGVTQFNAGAVATFKPNTSSATLSASGGSSALLLLNNWTAQYAVTGATLTTSDFGGLAFNVVDTSNHYELSTQDASSPTPNVMQLYKTVGGIRSAIGTSASISFTRTTSHTVSVTTMPSGANMIITASFDGVQVLAYTDVSPLGSGQVGLRNDIGSGASSSIYTAFSASSNDVPSLTKSVPAINYVPNNNFTSGSSGWTTTGSIGSITFPASGTYGSGAKCSLSVSNAAIGNKTASQSVLSTHVVIGQQYCFSAQVNITVAFVNADTFLEILFLDVSGATLLTAKSTFTAATSGYTRVNVTGTAPASTATITVGIGVETTVNGTNSGAVAWTGLQFEPMWFPNLYAYPTPICDFLQSDCITLPDGTTSRFDRIFAGFITHRKVSYGGTTRYWECEATSLDGMLENGLLVNATYTSTTDASIIINNINPIASLYLFASTPSVVTGAPLALAYRNLPVVVAGITIDSIQYADATLREVINSLTDQNGFLSGVDSYFNVYHYPPFTNIAAYGFSDNPDNSATFPYYDYTIDYDGTQFQNVINVSGNTYEIQITENFTAGDGTHTQFIVGGKTAGFYLTYPSAGTLAIPQVKFGGTLQTTAIDTGVGFGTSQTLIQYSNTHIGIATAINAGTSISVIYTYDALVYAQVQSPDSIAKYKRQFWSKINDTNLTSNASAVARGEAELEEYSDDRITLTFKTWKMLSPGQIIEFTSALDGLSKAHYVVQKVTAVFLGYDPVVGPINEYQVEAGIYVDDFIDFFRNTQKAVNRANHDPAAAIQQYNNLQLDSLNITDSLNIRVKYKPRVFGSTVTYPIQ